MIIRYVFESEDVVGHTGVGASRSMAPRTAVASLPPRPPPAPDPRAWRRTPECHRSQRPRGQSPSGPWPAVRGVFHPNLDHLRRARGLRGRPAQDGQETRVDFDLPSCLPMLGLSKRYRQSCRTRRRGVTVQAGTRGAGAELFW